MSTILHGYEQDARDLMRGERQDLKHNRRRDDALIASVNADLERQRRRQKLPLAWRARGALRDALVWVADWWKRDDRQEVKR